ncbi:MAG TPA: Asp23/Gls24 family envelope stress response protein [Acidimicrobiales bacterium]|nr:Asp23/Gls24 family envelope stress response protein [Acidimicrobiales bacterium]
MSDTNTQTQKQQQGSPAKSRGSSVAKLETDQGSTSIDDSVVAKIAAIAAREVDGVADLGGNLSGALGNVVGRIRGSEHRTTGVGVEVGSRQAAVDINCKMQYPASIHEVADSMRQNVIDRIESMTGLQVVEVNIAVNDLVFPGGENEESGTTSRVE